MSPDLLEVTDTRVNEEADGKMCFMEVKTGFHKNPTETAVSNSVFIMTLQTVTKAIEGVSHCGRGSGSPERWSEQPKDQAHPC